MGRWDASGAGGRVLEVGAARVGRGAGVGKAESTPGFAAAGRPGSTPAATVATCNTIVKAAICRQ